MIPCFKKTKIKIEFIKIEENDLTAKLKHINYVLKEQQNSAPSQSGVTDTVFTLLPKATKEK